MAETGQPPSNPPSSSFDRTMEMPADTSPELPEGDAAATDQVAAITSFDDGDDLLEGAASVDAYELDAATAQVRAIVEPLPPPPKAPSLSRPPPPRVNRSVPPPPKFDLIVPIDDVDDGLRAEENWEAVIEHYLAQIDATDVPLEKAKLLCAIATIFEERLGDAEQAFDGLVEALLLAPREGAIAYMLGAAARKADRWDVLFRTLESQIASGAVDARGAIAIFEHMIRWATVDRGAVALADAYAARIRAVAPDRPSAFPGRASTRPEDAGLAQREALARALVTATDPRDKCIVHIKFGEFLARQAGGANEAKAEFQKALALDPLAKDALVGMERVLRELGEFAALEDVLTRLATIADDDEERVEIWMRLAVLYERQFIKHDAAARTLEQVLSLRPGYVPALIALERAQHATRAWPELARTLEEHAAAVPAAQRIDVIEKIADVYESRLLNLDAAAATWARVLETEPRNERALTKVARLREKVGDWQSAATFRSQLATLAKTQDAAAKIHVTIGDLLAHDDRNRTAALLHYERAIELDPRNAAAWVAYEREARRAGDAARIERSIRERATHSHSPEERAKHLAELGEIRTNAGDDRAAIEMHARAFELDPRNETAAAALLDVYVERADWKNAAAPCRVLLAAATRDRDEDRRFDLLQTSIRIATRIGEYAQAVASATLAYELRPRDRGVRGELIETAHTAQANGVAIDEAKRALAKVTEDCADLPPSHLVMLADLQRLLGDPRAAEASARLVLERNPRDPNALLALAIALGTRREWDAAASTRLDLARVLQGDAAFSHYITAGDLWMQRAKNPAAAAIAYEEALTLKRDRRVLYSLVAAQTEAEDWSRLVQSLRAIIDLETDKSVRAKVVFTLAQVVGDKLGDRAQAARLFEDVISLDPSRLDAFEQLVRAHTELRDWAPLERAYRKMISKVDEGSSELRHALFHQLGLIYRDRMGRADDALEAFRAAYRAKATEEERTIILELLIAADRIGDALDVTNAALRSAPQSPAICRDLYELYLRARKYDRAWCAVDVLATFGPLDPTQTRFHVDYGPRDVADFPKRLPADAWRTHLLHAELDHALTAILAVTTSAIARSHEERRSPEGTPFDEQTSPLAQWIADTTMRAADILGMTRPRLLRRGGTTPFAIAMTSTPTLLVSLEAASSLPPADVPFLLGKRLAELRPELSARALMPTVTELGTAIAAAVRLAEGERARDATAAAIDAALAKHLTREGHETLRHAVSHAQRAGAKLDVKRWSQLADLSSTRVGLVLGGNVDSARRAMLHEVQWPTDLAPRERTSELFLFALGDAYADLRKVLGLAAADG